VGTANELLSNYQHIISGLTLVPGSRGVFDVEVNSEALFSKKDKHRHALPGEVLGLFTDLVGPGVPRYGT